MVCFMNKVDAVEDEELLELVELELRDLLTFYECAPARPPQRWRCPLLRGSQATCLLLLAAFVPCSLPVLLLQQVLEA